MKIYTIGEVKDTFIGEPGTPERTKYEAKLANDIQRGKIRKALIPFFPGGLGVFWASGQRHTFDEVVDAILKELSE